MKPTVFLASDSTVQTYKKDLYPQTGWGQVLISCFEKNPAEIRTYHPDTSRFDNAVCYETDRIIIDNRAFAGRSARSFWNEGRMEDIASDMKKGDYLLFQFAHNDANISKPERYISPEEYSVWLSRYHEKVSAAGGVFVPVTAVVMRNFLPDGTLPVSFPEYRLACLEYADRLGIPCLDLGELSRAHCEALGPKASEALYMCLAKGEYPGGPYCEGREDNAHLREKGARIYAGLLAEAIRKCPKLQSLAALLADSSRLTYPL